ncbi:MAG: YdiU family protein [Pseudanabaenaceae cyanobacterium SKYGB_i_bin29]|nr:YdiU family protein [Pseudanabaenaceae cyanobacterium SKYG29]MDW8421705.1 YdiU family protein [Pseudanabaenaceae cyanobacterium SKYGB_i_bin29]
MTNPFLQLNYEPAFESLGTEFYSIVEAAAFPQHILRWRNDALLPQIGLQPDQVKDEDFIEAFGHFRSVRPFLAMAYHGYQFGVYNPELGDGRGFLYGQVRGVDGNLYDFGTKGSGRTPYSRTADGRLTLKGGVREILAAEALHRLGVKTSRCLSMIETGEALIRYDEPSPTRSCVMVRFSLSHIRFGTFERLQYLKRPDLIQKLLDHVIHYYYSHLADKEDRYILFYQELVERIAILCAQWMAAGFCHAVLNTDNMSITGESFDYGPYAFLPTYEPRFTAAYFDYTGRYAYANQPNACYWNLERLQEPLAAVLDPDAMTAALAKFKDCYISTYERRMEQRLGLAGLDNRELENLIVATIQLLYATQWGYNEFFIDLKQQVQPQWWQESHSILAGKEAALSDVVVGLLQKWREIYHTYLQKQNYQEVVDRLRRWNPNKALIRPEIERIWAAITEEDNWQPFYELVEEIRA